MNPLKEHLVHSLEIPLVYMQLEDSVIWKHIPW